AYLNPPLFPTLAVSQSSSRRRITWPRGIYLPQLFFAHPRRNFATLLKDPPYSHNFSDAPQVANGDYPEYVAPKQNPVPTAISEAIEPAIASAGPLRRRLGDMNVLTFWLLIAVAAIVIIGASVGGAVGGTAYA